MSDFVRDLLRDALAERGIHLGDDPERGGYRHGEYDPEPTVKIEFKLTETQYKEFDRAYHQALLEHGDIDGAFG